MLQSSVSKLLEAVRTIREMPTVVINLQAVKADSNHPFFRKVTEDFYKLATRRHRKFPLIRQMEIGYAVCELTSEAATYSNRLDSAARRNLKKALRLGYGFSAIDYNAHLEDITAIHRSADFRQGKAMPSDIISREAGPHSNPPTLSDCHDYPYFGVFRDNELVAYAGCLIAGDLCEMQTIYGHAQFLPDGVVPLLIASIGDLLPRRYPGVKYFGYGTYFGATETMKRFKRKFLFQPRRVRWVLGA